MNFENQGIIACSLRLISSSWPNGKEKGSIPSIVEKERGKSDFEYEEFRGFKMKCARCQQDKEVQFRVFTEIMDIKVCADCAVEARGLRIGIEVLEPDREKLSEPMKPMSIHHHTRPSLVREPISEPADVNFSTTRRPFSGLLIIDMTHVFAGPFGTNIFNDLGSRTRAYRIFNNEQ